MPRIFKSADFDKNAQKASITDAELCTAIIEVIAGQCVDLGGGVYKKKLKLNQYRAIVLGKGKERWIYDYLFPKNALDNISPKELKAFRALAKYYANASEASIDLLLAAGDLMEICND